HEIRSVGLSFASCTPNSTSLGAVLKALTIRAFGIILASFSAPDDAWPTTSLVSALFIGSEHETTVLPEKSPACFKTSGIRDQCTARRRASESATASAGEPARALAFALRASLFSLSELRA